MSLDRYDAPSGAYTSLIPPGTRAFRLYVAEKFGISRTEVVRDRSRCQKQKSEHCECGAVDFFPAGKDAILGRRVFEWCVAVAPEAGIQSVIFLRRVIGFGNPRERAYTGPHPHDDHVHVGLNRWARQNLTTARLAAMDREQPDPPSEGEDDVIYEFLTPDEPERFIGIARAGEVVLFADFGDSSVRLATGVAGDFVVETITVPHGKHVRKPIRSKSGGPAHGISVRLEAGQRCGVTVYQ